MTQALASDSAAASPAPGEQQSGLGPPASSAPPTRTHPPTSSNTHATARSQGASLHSAGSGLVPGASLAPCGGARFLHRVRTGRGPWLWIPRRELLSCAAEPGPAPRQAHLPERKLADSEVVIPTRIHLSPGRAPAATFQAFPGHPKCHWVPSPPTRRAFRKTCARRLGGPQTGVCRRSPPNTIPVTTVALTLPSHPPCPGTGPSTKGTGSRRGRARPTVLSGAPGGAAPGSPAPGSGPSHWTTG